MRILVLGGGSSPEREVSFRSAAAVKAALVEAGFEVLFADPSEGLEVLDSLKSDDIVFPILHGADGEDGVIQRELEKRGIAYLGSTSDVSKICIDKDLSRAKFAEAGIPIAEGGSVTKESYYSHPLSKKPHVLKTSHGGSSIGTYIVKHPNQVDESKVSEVFELDEQAVIEEFIDGIEITVPVLDGKALPVIEIVPPEDGEFDYENKYNGKSSELCPAQSIDLKAQEYAQMLAEKAHNTLGCRHLSRTDIMVRRDGTMAVLEINTIPGMTDQSLYPLSARVAGLSMPDLMKKFVELVQRDYRDL